MCNNTGGKARRSWKRIKSLTDNSGAGDFFFFLHSIGLKNIPKSFTGLQIMCETAPEMDQKRLKKRKRQTGQLGAVVFWRVFRLQKSQKVFQSNCWREWRGKKKEDPDHERLCLCRTKDIFHFSTLESRRTRAASFRWWWSWWCLRAHRSNPQTQNHLSGETKYQSFFYNCWLLSFINTYSFLHTLRHT